MIAYVGLDLGVNTSVVTNSFAPKLHLRTPLEHNLEVEAEQGHSMETVNQLSVVLDIQPDDDHAQNI
jgi:hypothetical protein